MKTIILIIILSLASGSYNQSAIKDSSESKTEHVSFIEKKDINCFAGVDTNNLGQTIGCEGGTYKLIDNKYVIWINPDFPVQYDSCYKVTIDTSNGKHLTNLLIFDNKKSEFI